MSSYILKESDVFVSYFLILHYTTQFQQMTDQKPLLHFVKLAGV